MSNFNYYIETETIIGDKKLDKYEAIQETYKAGIPNSTEKKRSPVCEPLGIAGRQTDKQSLAPAKPGVKDITGSKARKPRAKKTTEKADAELQKAAKNDLINRGL